jgi:hypothetical protein
MMKDAKIEEQDKIMKNLQSENLRLKHGSDKIDVTDSYI